MFFEQFWSPLELSRLKRLGLAYYDCYIYLAYFLVSTASTQIH